MGKSVKKEPSYAKLKFENGFSKIGNAIGPIALGLKNYLFPGWHNRARWVAAFYSLVTNAKLQGVESFSYLRDVLSRISDHPL